MTNMTQKGRPAHAPLEQAAIAAVLGLALSLILSLVVFFGFELTHIGRVYSGVSVNGIDLGGKTLSEATATLSSQLNYTEQGRILLKDQDKTWSASPGQLGLFLDPQTSAQLAYQVGRSGSLWQRISDQVKGVRHGHQLMPHFIFDQRLAFQYLSDLASRNIDRPVVEPSLSIEGTQVIIHPGQPGRQLDINASLDAIGAQMETLQDGLLTLPVAEPDPVILDVNQQAELARHILSQPLTISMPAGETDQLGPWAFQPEEVAEMLIFQRVDQDGTSFYQVNLNYRMINDFLIRLAPALQKNAESTRFIFNDDTRQLDLHQPAVIGRTLDLQTSIDAIRQGVVDGRHNIPLSFIYSTPPVTDEATASNLGISELVRAETTYFYGSTGARIFNIALAASKFHGVLVAPGETFSMAKQMGEVSLEAGYRQGLIIYGDSTIEGVGGGVCQVSTTLFRTAFFAGFPIMERHSHAYRVSYYEKNAANQINPNLAGLDAAVFVPVSDFKFTNDTPYWLLMETYVDEAARKITWKFYSTNDGRSVEWNTTGPINIVEAPKPLYRENSKLAKGEVEQVDWQADGADVSVERIVYRNGEVHLRSTFHTHYRPWRAIYEYGPGTEGMPPKDAEKEDQPEE
jgi:vancomycin resistance protein YoaR